MQSNAASSAAATPIGNIVFTNSVGSKLDRMVEEADAASVFLLVDVNTLSFVLPRLQAESKVAKAAKVITVKAGEMHKNLDSLTYIWKQLGDNAATRESLLVNVGGGVVTDMGAFAAATFKRGIRFINVPTTLLSAVDASVGGKTGINFNGLKNEIGVFRDAVGIIISTTFFNTLTSQELLSGYAEMLKHGLLSSQELTERLLRYDVVDYDPESLLEMLRESVEVKRAFVSGDVEDRGIRHALNLGHTVGHAFESMALERRTPLAHGYAVAFGLICSLVLSHLRFGFPAAELRRYAGYVERHYGSFEISCDDYPRLLGLMHHDKKNSVAGEINATLLRAIGDVVVNTPVSDADMTAALDLYRDLLHLP